MEVLQVTSTPIYPPDQGGSHRSHGLVCSFPEMGDTVNRVCQGGLITNHDLPRISTRIEIKPGYVEHRPVNPFHDMASIPRGISNHPNVFLGNMLRAWPPRPLKRLLPDADIVLVEGPLQVPAIASMTVDTPVVYSSHNVETDRFAPLRERVFGEWTYRRLRQIEERAIQCSTAIVCTSEADRETYTERTEGDCPVIVAPNGISGDKVTSLSSGRGIDLRDRYGIPKEDLVAVFVGSHYEPNVEAAQYLVNNADEFRAVGTHLIVIGDVCTALDEVPENITSAGFVDDLQGHLRNADVALNPVVSGGGSNIKMLDYFVASLPVVSTPFGAEGIEVCDGQEVVVRDPEQFFDGLMKLSDSELRSEIGTAAQECAVENHLWEDISRDVRGEFFDLVNY